MITDDRNHPGIDKPRGPGEQNESYLVLSEEERARGYIRPVRESYLHKTCGTITTMPEPIAETYARDNTFYSSTWCCACRNHFPVAQFRWMDGSVLGS